MDRVLANSAQRLVKVSPQRLRFSLRTLLICILLASVCLAAFVWRRERARRQADLVARLQSSGADVWYDYQFAPRGDGSAEINSRLKSGCPEWLRAMVGIDFLHTVRGVHISSDDNCLYDSFDKELFHEALGSKQNLWYLSIHRQIIGDRELVAIANQHELSELRFSHVAFIDHDLSALGCHKRLRSLRFENAMLRDCELEPIGRIASLRALRIHDSNVSSEQLARIQSLPKLQTLSVFRTRPSNGDWSFLVRFPELEELLLSETDFSTSDNRHLASLKKLEYVRVGGEADSQRSLLREWAEAIRQFQP